MAIVSITTLPAGVDRDWMQAIRAEVDPDTNPPEGLIIHTEAEVDGRIKVVDVWETQEAHDRFGDERLGPAIHKVVAARGPQPESAADSEPATMAWEAFAVVHPRRG
jgi:hypothetical protein